MSPRYERIVETMAEGVWQVDAHATTTFVNQRMAEMLGYPVDEVLGRSPLSFVAPEAVHDLEAALASRPRGVVGHYDIELVRRDGSLFSASVSASPLFDCVGVYEGSLAIVTDAAERRRADEALRSSEARYRALFEHSPYPKWVYDVETLGFLEVNDAAAAHFGYTREELLGMSAADVHPDGELAALTTVVADRNPAQVQPRLWKHRRKDGTLIDVEVSWHPFVLDGRDTRMGVGRDVTDRVRLEEQLRQAQKMEAIGSLAGGVAHDFNNVLSVILSYASLALDTVPVGNTAREDLEEIRMAGERAAVLTRQLLAFSRQQVLRPRLVEVTRLVGDLEKMLRRLVGEDVALTLRTPELSAVVSADPSQLEQIIMNLSVNARDAMPEGGELVIETASEDIVAPVPAYPAVPAGHYVVLRVTDTGTGMDRPTMARIFEPFFTTKPVGRGTGLGLSTVFGIVRQSGGHISVESEPGKGTTFVVHLPRVREDAPRISAEPPSSTFLKGTETVLLVEDDDQVRGIARTILRRHGYEVIEAANGGEALLICEQHEKPIHVLLTDVVMPRMNGRLLARRLAELRPEMRVVCMSGHTPAEIGQRDTLPDDVAFLQKPFTPDALLTTIREVLGREPGRAKCAVVQLVHDGRARNSA
jgi:two-component system, cell cycle sensor histidine kinase and response regulator CckA